MNSLSNRYAITKNLTSLLFAIISYLLLSLCVGNWPLFITTQNADIQIREFLNSAVYVCSKMIGCFEVVPLSPASTVI